MIIDIIIFAAIAVFFVWKLRSVLGQRTGEERDRGNPFAVAEQPEPEEETDAPVIIEGQARSVAPEAPANSLAGAINQVRQLDPAFDEKHFLAGARAAFTLIVEAFAKGDEAALKNLLRPTVLAGFVNEIARRKAAGEIMETRIVRLLAADISAARTDGKTAVVTVDFTSEQVSFTKNGAGEVIDGDEKKLQHVAESWTFERDTTLRDPNWFLTATRAH